MRLRKGTNVPVELGARPADNEDMKTTGTNYPDKGTCNPLRLELTEPEHAFLIRILESWSPARGAGTVTKTEDRLTETLLSKLNTEGTT